MDKKTVPGEEPEARQTANRTNGAELGAVALVRPEVSIEGTDKTLPVPCYILNSDKPLWKGEL